MRNEPVTQTAWEKAKQYGTTISRAAKLYGCTPSNLSHKYKSKPQQFEIICLGVVAYDQKQQ